MQTQIPNLILKKNDSTKAQTFPPQKRLSDLVGNLKATASKTMWRNFESKLSLTYQKKVFWTSSYFIASCGGVTLDTLKKYLQAQNSPSPSKP